MGSVGSVRLAAETRLEGEAQRRLCEMRRVVMRGWPTVATGECNTVGGDSRDREAVCRIWVCGMDTVITMRRGGFGDGGAAACCAIFDAVSVPRDTILCFYGKILARKEDHAFPGIPYLMPLLQPCLRIVADDKR